MKEVENCKLKELSKKLKPYIKRIKKIIKFDDTETEEHEFHQYKSLISINDIDVDNIVVSNLFLFGKLESKYFTGYKDSEKIRPLYIFCPQMIIYKTTFNENRRIYFLIKEEKVFIKYIESLEKVSNTYKNKFNSELIYSKKYLKAKKNKHKRTSSVFICTNNIDRFDL